MMPTQLPHELYVIRLDITRITDADAFVLQAGMMGQYWLRA